MSVAGSGGCHAHDTKSIPNDLPTKPVYGGLSNPDRVSSLVCNATKSPSRGCPTIQQHTQHTHPTHADHRRCHLLLGAQCDRVPQPRLPYQHTNTHTTHSNTHRSSPPPPAPGCATRPCPPAAAAPLTCLRCARWTTAAGRRLRSHTRTCTLARWVLSCIVCVCVCSVCAVCAVCVWCKMDYSGWPAIAQSYKDLHNSEVSDYCSPCVCAAYLLLS